MEVHLHDLQCDESRLIERGFFPRWARHRNWLFYVRILPGRGRERQNAVEVRWLDLETGRHTTLATGVENLDETSFDDRYIYGARRFRGQNPEFVTVRIPLQPGAGPEELRQAVGSQLLPNPRHPVFFTHEHGRLIRREYFQPGAGLASRELFDAAGFVTESIRFRPSDGQPIETDHWWFERGVPFRQVSGKDEFLKRGEQWISKATGKSWTR